LAAFSSVFGEDRRNTKATEEQGNQRDSRSSVPWAGAWDSAADIMALGGMEDAAAFDSVT